MDCCVVENALMYINNKGVYSWWSLSISLSISAAHPAYKGQIPYSRWSTEWHNWTSNLGILLWGLLLSVCCNVKAIHCNLYIVRVFILSHQIGKATGGKGGMNIFPQFWWSSIWILTGLQNVSNVYNCIIFILIKAFSEPCGWGRVNLITTTPIMITPKICTLHFCHHFQTDLTWLLCNDAIYCHSCSVST